MNGTRTSCNDNKGGGCILASTLKVRDKNIIFACFHVIAPLGNLSL